MPSKQNGAGRQGGLAGERNRRIRCGPRHARQAIELQSCRYVNIKPGRVGGLTNAVLIHDLCQRAGIPCWVGGMLLHGIRTRDPW